MLGHARAWASINEQMRACESIIKHERAGARSLKKWKEFESASQFAKRQFAWMQCKKDDLERINALVSGRGRGAKRERAQARRQRESPQAFRRVQLKVGHKRGAFSRTTNPKIPREALRPDPELSTDDHVDQLAVRRCFR